jgi:hypothetical protein
LVRQDLFALLQYSCQLLLLLLLLPVLAQPHQGLQLCWTLLLRMLLVLPLHAHWQYQLILYLVATDW